MSETKRKSSFEDHINIVESGQKTASANVDAGEGSLLDKLAAELDNSVEKVAEVKTVPETGGAKAPPGGAPAGTNVTDKAAPAAEGAVQPAASSVAGAADAVTAAIEAVATPQTEIAGGNNEEATAGEEPAQTKPNEGTAISAGDGIVIDANQMHRTPSAVAEAATPTSKTASDAEATAIGQKIAESFQAELEKKAKDGEYVEALGLLKEAGILDAYDIKDEGFTKEAEDRTDYLTKIASNVNLSREDIIGGAYQYIGMTKEAEEADAAGRQAAHDVADFLKEYEAEKIAGNSSEVDLAKEVALAKVASENDGEKVAELLKDPEVVAAVNVLKAKNVL